MKNFLARIRSKVGGWLYLILVVVAFAFGYLIRGESETTPAPDESAAAHTEETVIWTCSMHPQIRQPNPGRCPICGMDLVPISSGGGEEDEGPRELSMSETARKLAEITTAPVERRPVAAEIRMVGKVDYDETRLGYITARVPGRLDRLYVDYTGVSVDTGDPMVSLYSPELLAAQEELLQAIEVVGKLRNGSSKIVQRTAHGTVEAVREKLRLWGLTSEQIAEIEHQGEATDHVTIYAPLRGTVIHKDAFVGMYVTTGTRIYTLADLSRVWINLDAYESDIQWIQVGQEVEFTAEAYPGEVFTGQIAFVDPVLTPRTRTVKLRVEVENPEERLKPEMFVRAIVRAQISDPDPLVIPASAPLITGTRSVAYVEIPDREKPTYEGREIVLGPRAGEHYLVQDGLHEGERVVVHGSFKIDSALQILAKPSMMNPEGGVAGGGHQHHAGEPAMTPKPASPEPTGPVDVPPTFRTELSPLYDAYFSIHTALAGDDTEAAAVGFGAVKSALGDVDMALLAGRAHDVWMTFLDQLDRAAVGGEHSEDLESARTAFLELSHGILHLVEQFGHAGEAAYYQAFCPMAFDNTGAYWLQTLDEIRNPFFGESMLMCGEIQKTFPPVASQ